MTATDIKGLGVSTKSSDALAAYERGLDLFLRWRGGAVEVLDAAVQSDARFALAHCTKAYVAWRMGRADLATAAARQATAAGDAARFPTDRIAVRIIGLNCITQGDYRGGIDIARRSLEASPDEPQYQTMLGFFLEQSGYNDEGLAMSLRSLAQDPTSLYTYHAVAHAYQARGDYPKALETFERAASLERYAHILWHLAEARSILGYDRMTRDYWASTAPPLPVYERIELLWRLEVLRGTKADDAVWRDLAKQGERVLAEYADWQTTWMHHWLGVAFAKAGDWTRAAQQVDRLRRMPAGRPS